MNLVRFSVIILLLFVFCEAKTKVHVKCSTLRRGQYLCPHPEMEFIDPKTQQPKDCTRDNKALIWCQVDSEIICLETGKSAFQKETSCKYTNGYHFETALLLSIFLGMLGADRFYLGYPALGLLKFCTMGFMFLGQLIDIILIATQVVGPADGSNYIIPYYGAGITIVRSDNNTYLLPREDWL